jgi:hypothetical protein
MPPATVNRSRRFHEAWSFLRFFAGNFLRRNKDPQYVLCRKGYLSLLELLRLRLQNRTTSTLLGRAIGITDSFWYLHSLSEIFVQEVYCFQSAGAAPYILDCGSNIGLSVIYFKRRFPDARIVAFEPDPANAALLQRNLHAFHHDDVDVKIKAVWREDTVLRFSRRRRRGRKAGLVNRAGRDPDRHH